jgi:hypothetical protein
VSVPGFCPVFAEAAGPRIGTWTCPSLLASGDGISPLEKHYEELDNTAEHQVWLVIDGYPDPNAGAKKPRTRGLLKG